MLVVEMVSDCPHLMESV